MSALQQILASFSNYIATGGNTITGGTSVNIQPTNNATAMFVAALDSTHVICVYGGVLGTVYAQVLTVSGTTISAGTAVSVQGSSGIGVTVTALSSTLAMLVYNSASGGNLRAVALNISGTTVSLGTIASFNTPTVGNSSMCVSAINSTQAICTYKNGNPANTVIITTDGTTTTFGTAAVLTANFTNSTTVATISSSQAVAAWIETTGVVKSCVLGISGTTITVNAVATVETLAASPATGISISKLTSSKLVCVYATNTGGVFTERGTVISVSGTTVSAGSVIEIVNTGVAGMFPVVSAKSATQAICTYGVNSPNAQNAQILNISGTTLSGTSGFALNASKNAGDSIVSISATQSVAVYIGSPASGQNARVLTN